MMNSMKRNQLYSYAKKLVEENKELFYNKKPIELLKSNEKGSTKKYYIGICESILNLAKEKSSKVIVKDYSDLKQLPLDIENLIMDYKCQLEHVESFSRCLYHIDRMIYKGIQRDDPSLFFKRGFMRWQGGGWGTTTCRIKSYKKYMKYEFTRLDKSVLKKYSRFNRQVIYETGFKLYYKCLRRGVKCNMVTCE